MESKTKKKRKKHTEEFKREAVRLLEGNRQRLALHGVVCSMSAAGNCYDNAVAESFFATLKKELVHGCAFETRSEAYDAISDYIDNYYNAKRRHSAAGNQSPINFELANAGQLAASSPKICPDFPGNSTFTRARHGKTSGARYEPL